MRLIKYLLNKWFDYDNKMVAIKHVYAIIKSINNREKLIVNYSNGFKWQELFDFIEHKGLLTITPQQAKYIKDILPEELVLRGYNVRCDNEMIEFKKKKVVRWWKK